ncbi:MAG: glycosyltransferase [Deltaproteobacteria bacterium]|nr:glycosyltransferase [Deltaproteobacteria bacterium]
MERWPRISLVTPSFNQGRYIAETIDSVVGQNYPNLEHLVMDGGSSDDTLGILKRYPHLTVVSEPDRGQADAINKGFRRATGEIWGFLNSDDTLLPGALQRIAQEINPQHGRHVIMGRCRFIDESGRFIGIEHPSQFTHHRRVLEVWKGYTIPQPATFWTPDVWRNCGPLAENLPFAWIDYDLFCRFSQRYRFCFVDQVLATYRLHTASKTGALTEAQRREESIQISRHYWGKPWSRQYWQLTLSLAWYRFNRVGRARRWLRQAQEAWDHRQPIPTVAYGLAGGLLAPEVAFYVCIYPFLRNHTKGLLRQAVGHLARLREVYPQTAAYLDYTEPWSDGWVGPRVVVTKETEYGGQMVSIRGEVDRKYLSKPLVLTVFADGREIGRQCIEQNGSFELELPLSQPLPAGLHRIEVQASTWFVPHRFARNGDYRPLAWRLTDISLPSCRGCSRQT